MVSNKSWQQSKRDAAIREALLRYPTMSPVLAGWVFDYIESIGEKEFIDRVNNGDFE